MNMKKIKTLLLVLVMVLSVALAACGGQNGADASADGEATDPGYRVKVVDAFGAPVTSGVIVRFMQNGEQVSMQPVGEDGIAAKELEAGTYDVELKFTDSDAAYYYDQTGLTISENSDVLEIKLYSALSGQVTSVHAYSLQTQDKKEHDAYSVGLGGTYVELTPGERNYFLFTPTQGGTYEFSVQDSDAVIGYYGAPHFIQDFTMIEPVDNVISESIRDSMIGNNGTGTTVMVLGLDASAEDTGAILTIRRTGEPAWSVEDEPWQVYQPTIELTAYTHPAGASLGEFDLTAPTGTYNLVLGADNYYHLDSADGPLVLVRLGEKSGGSKYLDPFETIIAHSGVTKYFYDEEDNFVKKESYTECLYEYVNYDDEQTGLYPLTEDLKYIIQMRGDHYGWFDENSPGYIFYDQNQIKETGLNPEYSWLFYCCYIQN